MPKPKKRTKPVTQWPKRALKAFDAANAKAKPVTQLQIAAVVELVNNLRQDYTNNAEFNAKRFADLHTGLNTRINHYVKQSQDFEDEASKQIGDLKNVIACLAAKKDKQDERIKRLEASLAIKEEAMAHTAISIEALERKSSDLTLDAGWEPGMEADAAAVRYYRVLDSARKLDAAQKRRLLSELVTDWVKS